MTASSAPSTDSPGAKDRILQAAIRLFANKGYAATGLREIVREAGVSLAMVNYHFGSKQALLETILNQFFERTIRTARAALTSADTPEEKLHNYIHHSLQQLRQNPELVRIVITELPYEGIFQLKVQQIGLLLELFSQHLLPVLPAPVRDRLRLEILGPAVAGMMTFHFLLRPVIERAFSARFDDAFYLDVADELTELILYGAMRHVQTTRGPSVEEH